MCTFGLEVNPLADRGPQEVSETLNLPALHNGLAMRMKGNKDGEVVVGTVGLYAKERS